MGVYGAVFWEGGGKWGIILGRVGVGGKTFWLDGGEWGWLGVSRGGCTV